MKIAVGADHRGFEHKEYLKKQTDISGISIDWIDVGAYHAARSDYPIFAQKACYEMLNNGAGKAILICGTGVGMAMAANRFKKIYAAVAWNEEIARLCVQDDNANVLVIPSDFVSCEQALALVKTWIATPFKGGRYQDRISMIDAF